MFDTTTEIAFKERLIAKGQEVVMRWPTDDEWAERARRRKVITKNLGRGIRETNVDTGELDQKLFEKIKLNGAPPLTVGEASKVIEVIGQCEVTDVQIEGEEAIVDLQVYSGTVQHRLKLPTMDQVTALRKKVKVLDLPYNVQEMRVYIEPGAQLYDACAGHSEDYKAGVIPSLHKDGAMRAVIEYLDRETSAAKDEKSF